MSVFVAFEAHAWPEFRHLSVPRHGSADFDDGQIKTTRGEGQLGSSPPPPSLPNLGVIVGAVFIRISESAIPDLVVGGTNAAIALGGAMRSMDDRRQCVASRPAARRAAIKRAARVW